MTPAPSGPWSLPSMGEACIATEKLVAETPKHKIKMPIANCGGYSEVQGQHWMVSQIMAGISKGEANASSQCAGL